ncbi:MAG: GGDEF domain-containing protein [Candidatus Devosia euplotis]|nr:GGDEF domain-containing protein [Candidatus Devosia euplotis]
MSGPRPNYGAAALADHALSDPLTGIANRRSFDPILNRLAGTAISVAIIDLDYFKSVNDRFSHIVGDAVLQRVARTLVDQLGAHGHAAFLGSEEFGLILPDMPEASAIAICEGVRVAIAATDWTDLGIGLRITASIGLVSGKGDVPSGVLMQSADNLLYTAKANGRDCVASSDSELAAMVVPQAGRLQLHALTSPFASSRSGWPASPTRPKLARPCMRWPTRWSAPACSR